MALGDLVYSRLSTYQAIIDVVEDRIYPVTLPEQPTYPAIIYEETAGQSANTGDGYLQKATLRAMACADNYDESKAIGEIILIALRGYKRTDSTPLLISMQDEFRQDLYLPDIGIYGDVIEFSAWTINE